MYFYFFKFSTKSGYTFTAMLRSIILCCSFIFTIHHLQGQNGLSYYVNAAKANSPLIQDNRNQSEAAKVEAERLKAFYTKPQVTLIGSVAVSPIISKDNGKSEFLMSPGDHTDYIGYDIAASNGGVYQGLINVNQPLFNGNKYKIAAEQVNVGILVNQNAVRISEHDIEKLVTDQYILCLQDMKQSDYISSLLQTLSDQKTVVEKFAENGILKQSDVLLLKIENETQLNFINQYKATYRRDLMDLNVLCGISDTSYVVLQDINLSTSTPISTSMFNEKYRLDSLNLLAAQHIFDLKYKPQLSAFANGGLNGVYVPTLPNRFGLSAGLNFSMYLFDGRQKSLNKKKTDILIKSTQAYKSNFITQNTIRKNRLLNEIRALDQRMDISAGQLKDYQKLLEFYKKEVITGQQSAVAYINTVKSLGALQRDYVLMQTNRQLLINAYNYWNW